MRLPGAEEARSHGEGVFVCFERVGGPLELVISNMCIDPNRQKDRAKQDKTRLGRMIILEQVTSSCIKFTQSWIFTSGSSFVKIGDGLLGEKPGNGAQWGTKCR